MQPHIGLSAVVDIFDRTDLFQTIDNKAILELSRLGENRGFSGIDTIRRSTGVEVRRVLARNVSSFDLAEAICIQLQSATQTSLQDFSRILLCHSGTDDTACEGLSKFLRERFRLRPGQIHAANHGCSGFLRLMQDGVLHLEVSPGEDRIALLSIETPETWHDASDRLFCGIVSAGATAAVLERNSGLPVGIVRSEDFEIPVHRRINNQPLFHKDLSEVYTFDGVPVNRTVMRMNAEPVFLNGIELMLDNLRAAMDSIERKPGERVIVAPHQPSGKLLKALIASAKLEFPEIEVLNNLENYGNMISSSVPVLLSQLPNVLSANGLRPLRNNDHIILLAAGICMARIESHMSAGHACLRWMHGTLISSGIQGIREDLQQQSISTEYRPLDTCATIIP